MKTIFNIVTLMIFAVLLTAEPAISSSRSLQEDTPWLVSKSGSSIGKSSSRHGEFETEHRGRGRGRGENEIEVHRSSGHGRSEFRDERYRRDDRSGGERSRVRIRSDGRIEIERR